MLLIRSIRVIHVCIVMCVYCSIQYKSNSVTFQLFVFSVNLSLSVNFDSHCGYLMFARLLLEPTNICDFASTSLRWRLANNGLSQKRLAELKKIIPSLRLTHNVFRQIEST